MSPKSNTVGLAMIVKDEENFIEQCLKSVDGVFDQIVVVDTGSTDKTIDIIREKFPNVELYEHPWEKSFSKARNQSLSYIKTMWVMYLDADEIIEPGSGQKIRHMVNQPNPKFPIILINIYNQMKEGVKAYLYYPRLWRRFWRGKDLNIHFEGDVHNQLVYPMNLVVAKTDINIVHFGYSLDGETMAKKHRRSQELLENQIRENSDNFFAHLNLAQLLRARGDIYGTIEHAEKVIKLCSPDDLKTRHAYLMALDQLGTSFLQLGRYVECERVSLEALKLKGDYLDPPITLMSLYLIKGILDKAEFWAKKYLEVQEKYEEQRDVTNLILNHLHSRSIAQHTLGHIYLSRGDFFRAKNYFNQVLGTSHYKDTDIKLAEISYNLFDYTSARKWLKSAKENMPEDNYTKTLEFAADNHVASGKYEIAKIFYRASEKSDSSKAKLFALEKMFGRGMVFPEVNAGDVS